MNACSYKHEAGDVQRQYLIPPWSCSCTVIWGERASFERVHSKHQSLTSLRENVLGGPEAICTGYTNWKPNDTKQEVDHVQTNR